MSKIDELCIRLIEGDSGLKPPHDRRRGVVCANDQLATRNGRKLVIKRRPKFLETGKLKIRRHNANDGCSFAVHSNALSDHIGIAIEIAFPNFMTENDDLFCTGFIIRGCEIAAKDRRYSSDLEKIFCDVTAIVTLRFIFVGDVDSRSTEIAR